MRTVVVGIGGYSELGDLMSYIGWGFQDFAQGVIAGTDVTITDNENGSNTIFTVGQIVSSSAIIAIDGDPERKPYTGTTRFFSTLVKVSSHTTNSVTLSGIPNTNWGNLRIWFLYDYQNQGMPLGYEIAPKVVSSSLFSEINALFITEEELNALATRTLDTYTRTITLGANAAVLGASAPALVEVGTVGALAFDADAETAYLNLKIPDDWDGASDITLEVHWFPESGAAIGDGQTIKWDIEYRVHEAGEVVDAGSAVSITATYTQSGAGTDKESIETNLTIDYDNGDQPLTAGDVLNIKFNRDMTADTYASDANVMCWHLHYTANNISLD